MLQRTALYYGMNLSDFWQSDVAEINDFIEVGALRRQDEEKLAIGRAYTLADAIASRIGSMFNDKLHIMQPWDSHPSLFAQERDAQEEAERREALERYKSARKAQAERLKGEF